MTNEHHTRSPHMENLALLCERLRSERLLVSSEQSILHALTSKVQTELGELNQLTWICSQERSVLHRLINSDPCVSPENSCRLMMAINASNFNDGYKGFGHHVSGIAQVFHILLQSPKAFAEFLNSAEKMTTTSVIMDELNSTVFNVLYGSCVFPKEERSMLDLLAHLISLQLVVNPDPRKMLRKGNSTFSRLYMLFTEELFSAKIFLTAALHEPIMHLLSQDDLFLDTDPSKSPIRFPAAERVRRFGTDEHTRHYKERVAQHRAIIVEKLVKISEKFVTAIQNAMSCFPPSLTWLVRQLHTALIEKKRVSKGESALICTDLLFTNFLCSATINPEPLGIISHTPISHIARFNLMQVGQILQTLALLPYEQPPPYFGDLLSRFDQTAMPQIVDCILQSDSVSLDSVFPNVVSSSDGVEVYCRKACIGTVREINTLTSFLKSPAIDEINDVSLRKNLKNIIKKLPPEFRETDLSKSSSGSDRLSSSSVPSRSNSSGRLKNLADKVHSAASKGHQRLIQNSNVGARLHQRLTQSSSTNFPHTPTLSESFPGAQSFDSPTMDSPVRINEPTVEGQSVFVIPLVSGESDAPIGLRSEDDVMQSFTISRKHKTSLTEKKTRFVATAESVVSDRTTDAVSDDDEDDVEVDETGGAAGEGSSCSSSNDNIAGEDVADEDEPEDVSTLPDNFSDVVAISANVSARGSNASFSGERADTPFSGNAAAEQNEPPAPSSMVAAAASTTDARTRPQPTNIPVTIPIRKQNTEGLDEKFGKFALPPHDPSRYRDETYSLVSDSWSTDVVASDNEGFNETRNDLALPHQLLNIQRNVNAVPPPQIPINGPIMNLQPIHVLNVTAPVAVVPPPHPVLPIAQPGSSQSHQRSQETDLISFENPYYDPENLLSCKAFLDAKRKIRLVLASASIVPRVGTFHGNAPPNGCNGLPNGGGLLANNHLLVDSLSIPKCEDELGSLNDFLKLLLAESVNNCDKNLSAQIREVQRCLTAYFDNKGVHKLLKVLKDDHRQRTHYLLYLQQSRLTLLQLNYYYGRIKARICREKSLTAECLVEILVRFYLENKDHFLRQFIHDFQHLKAQDEKTDAVEMSLHHLYDQLVAEPMWRHATKENLDCARRSLERALSAHVYMLALYPNGEADACRDDVFFNSIRAMASLITVNHPELGIPKKLHGEAPWPSAQAEIQILNAYKSPRDKMACVTRCCETVENLLLMNLPEGQSVSADDLLPILVFILIQANPPSILSTIQYINDFYGRSMMGKEAYWWVQFTASVEFLKTLMNKLLQ